MTILAGFACPDGIVIGSDSEETRGTIKVPVPKIEVFRGKACTCVLAGAGDGDLFTVIAEEVERHIQSVGARPRLHPIREFIDKIVVDVHKVYANEPAAESEVTILAAVWVRNASPALIRSGRKITVPIKRHETVGYGQDLAAYLVDTLYDESRATVHFMERLAAYVLRQTKKYAPFCGGDSQIFTLLNDGTVRHMSPEHIFRDERYATLTTMAARHLFYAADPYGPEDEFNRQIEALGDGLRELRTRFRRTIRDIDNPQVLPGILDNDSGLTE